MSKRELRRVYRPGFAADVKALPTSRLQTIVLQRLVDVSKGRLQGVPLERRASTGDLGDCRKLYFDETGGRRPDYRLVYRLLPDEVHAVAVEAVAVGRREALQVYLEAARRLGRSSEGD